jgi:hypothetical protein
MQSRGRGKVCQGQVLNNMFRALCGRCSLSPCVAGAPWNVLRHPSGVREIFSQPEASSQKRQRMGTPVYAAIASRWLPEGKRVPRSQALTVDSETPTAKANAFKGSRRAKRHSRSCAANIPAAFIVFSKCPGYGRRIRLPYRGAPDLGEAKLLGADSQSRNVRFRSTDWRGISAAFQWAVPSNAKAMLSSLSISICTSFRLRAGTVHGGS